MFCNVIKTIFDYVHIYFSNWSQYVWKRKELCTLFLSSDVPCFTWLTNNRTLVLNSLIILVFDCWRSSLWWDFALQDLKSNLYAMWRKRSKDIIQQWSVDSPKLQLSSITSLLMTMFRLFIWLGVIFHPRFHSGHYIKWFSINHCKK